MIPGPHVLYIPPVYGEARWAFKQPTNVCFLKKHVCSGALQLVPPTQQSV